MSTAKKTVKTVLKKVKTPEPVEDVDEQEFDYGTIPAVPNVKTPLLYHIEKMGSDDYPSVDRMFVSRPVVKVTKSNTSCASHHILYHTEDGKWQNVLVVFPQRACYQSFSFDYKESQGKDRKTLLKQGLTPVGIQVSYSLVGEIGEKIKIFVDRIRKTQFEMGKYLSDPIQVLPANIVESWQLSSASIDKLVSNPLYISKPKDGMEPSTSWYLEIDAFYDKNTKTIKNIKTIYYDPPKITKDGKKIENKVSPTKYNPTMDKDMILNIIPVIGFTISWFVVATTSNRTKLKAKIIQADVSPYERGGEYASRLLEDEREGVMDTDEVVKEATKEDNDEADQAIEDALNAKEEKVAAKKTVPKKVIKTVKKLVEDDEDKSAEEEPKPKKIIRRIIKKPAPVENSDDE